MATRFYFRSTASDINPTSDVERKMQLTQDTVSGQATILTTAGGTLIKYTDDPNSGTGTPLTFLTMPLNGVTISGTVTLNIGGREASMLANAQPRVIIERCNNDGSVIDTIIDTNPASEWGTSFEIKNWTGSPTSRTLTTGQRIKVTVYITNSGTMASGHVCYFGYNNSGGTGTDSWVEFTETVTEEGAAQPQSIRSMHQFRMRH